MPLLVLLVAALALIVAENAAAAAAPPPRWAVRLWLDEDGALVDAAAAAEPASWREEEVALLRRYAATLPDAIATAERRSLRLERRAATAVKRAQARARSVDAGRALADALGLVHVDTVGELLDTHVLSVPDKAAGAANASAADAFEAALRAHPWVRWVERQWPRARQLRAAVPSFNDPQFKDQWHLYNQASPGNDEQVVEVWAQGITGAGVVVAMVDDGVHYKHPDLTDAINWDGTFNFVNKNYDPTPQFGDDHGTRCAAQIVAKPNNGVCGVGIAYGAQLSGTARVLSSSLSRRGRARGLTARLPRRGPGLVHAQPSASSARPTPTTRPSLMRSATSATSTISTPTAGAPATTAGR